MDRRIYRSTNAEFGIYSARRLPKGNASASLLAPSGGGVTVDKPNYSAIDMSFEGTIAPALNAIKKDYTVPKGRRASLQNARASAARRSAGGPNDFCESFIGILRAGNGNIEYIVKVHALIAAVGTEIDEVSGFGVVDLFEGDRVIAVTSDSSVGGTIQFIANASIIEFDASIKYNPQTGNSDPRFSDNAPSAPAAVASYQGFSSGPMLYAPAAPAPAPQPPQQTLYAGYLGTWSGSVFNVSAQHGLEAGTYFTGGLLYHADGTRY